MQINEAIKLPFKAEQVGEFSTTAVFWIPGFPGIYRRVSRQGRSSIKSVGEGNVLAIVDGKLGELCRWTEVEEMLFSLIPPPPPVAVGPEATNPVTEDSSDGTEPSGEEETSEGSPSK